MEKKKKRWNWMGKRKLHPWIMELTGKKIVKMSISHAAADMD
jgi:hypothetical protein